MSLALVARWTVPGVIAEIQVIEGEDGATWVRLERDGRLVAVWSAAAHGTGVVSTPRVVQALAHAATTDDVHAVTNHMKFLGWEFWPAVPLPIADYLRDEFDGHRQAADAQPAY